MRDLVQGEALRDGAWERVNPRPHRVTFDLSHFAGVRTGLFCQAARQIGGIAGFSHLTYHVTED